MLLFHVIMAYTIVSIKAYTVSGAHNIEKQICSTGCISA